MATIVFVNEQEQTVTIVQDKTVDILDWADIGSIAASVAGKEVYYVTAAEYVPGQAVIDLLSEALGIDPSVAIPRKKRTYLRSKSNTKLICRGKNGEIVFNGPMDMKPIDELPPDIFETNVNLQKCIDIGRVEIIDDLQKSKIVAQESKRPKIKNARDIAIDSILIKTSVDDFMKNGGADGDDIAPEIDVSSSTSFKRNDEQESYANMKKLGIQPD